MKILHVEDSVEDAELVRVLLTEVWPECAIDVTADPNELVSHLAGKNYDLILSDFSLGSFTGLDALRLAHDNAPATPFIFLSGTIGEDRAIEALRAGAKDYVIKDRMKRLVTAIERALQDAEGQRKRQEAEQRLSKQAEALNKARDAIIITDLDGIIRFWNQGAERIIGWAPEAAVGKDLVEVLGPGAHDELKKAQLALVITDDWRGDLHVEGKNSKPLVIEFGITLIRNDSGKPESRLCIGTDVTEKKTLEEKFLRVQRLESIGMLASGIAHDLNNVLAPILLAAPMLRDHVSNPIDVSLLNALEKGAERGAGLVRQILSFARGTGGEKQEIQVKHLLRDMALVIKETFPKNIELQHSADSTLWPIVGNPTQIHQVLLNLCVNARDAMSNGGTLTLRAENCFLDVSAASAIEGAQPGAWVVLHVEDTGTGIPLQTLARIWEPFFTTKGEGKGTGLGLSTVRGIVEALKGFIVLKTESGRGTTFRVYFPAVDIGSENGSKTSAHPFAVRGKGELILVVDDEAQIREAAAATLAHYGYRVLPARDGAEALALFAVQASEISVVITDVNMPHLDGGALAKVVCQMNAKTKVIAMSGMNSGGRRPQAQNLEHAFLHKPFTAEALLLAVHKLLHPEAQPESDSHLAYPERH
jgi:two-component system cell cycle sensor histidine kinase/response regulator CckA